MTAVAVGTFPMPFRIVFKHTAAARAGTENVIVRLTDDDGLVGHGEGCPRSYVTGESVPTALAFLRQHAPALAADVGDVDALRRWISANEAVIDDHPAAFCALELALLDLLGRRSGRTVESLLGQAELTGPFRYSAVLGDSGPIGYGLQILRYRAGGLRHYKLKLSGDLRRDRSKVRWFQGRLGRWMAKTVRVDANNLWTDVAPATRHLQGLQQPLLGIEEPLGADRLSGFLEVAEALDSRIILDESLLRRSQLTDLPGPPNRWILNCRVSKSGGLVRSLQLIDAARRAGLGIIVGAHVGESSLLTRAALTAAAAAGPALLAQEGAFGTRLLTEDLVTTPLMFGRGGVLGPAELAAVGGSGLGVEVVEARLADLTDLAVVQ